MIFFGRIDESDTHGPKPDMVMSALLGSGDQWSRVRRGLKPLQRGYGFSVFHGTEFKGQTGDFAGWSAPKCIGLLHDMGKLVSDNLTECITITCSHDVYQKHFLDVRPPKMHRTSQYGICFEAILDGLIKHVMDQGRRHKPSVIVEDGHENATDTARIFHERKKQYEARGIDILRSHTLISKEVDPLLMFADTTAYGSAQEARAKKRGEARQFTDSPGAREPRRNETGWTVAEMSPQFLELLIEEFEAGRAAKHEEHLKRRAEWLASQTRSS